jgi:hypothetical protein
VNEVCKGLSGTLDEKENNHFFTLSIPGKGATQKANKISKIWDLKNPFVAFLFSAAL